MHINYAEDVLCFCVRVPCGEKIEMRAPALLLCWHCRQLGHTFFFSY